jgi:hypothetical protein
MLVRSFSTRFASAFLAAVAALAGFVAPSARGDIIVSYQDVGTDLQFSWSGSLPFAATGTLVTNVNNAQIGSQATGTTQSLYAFNGNYRSQNMNSTRTPISGTGIFANLFSTKFGTRTGDTFGLSFPTSQAGNTSVFLPGDYTANDPISGTLTIPNFSVDDAGLSDWSFALGAGGNVIFEAVPEPGTLWLGTAAVATLSLAGVRRRRRCCRAGG